MTESAGYISSAQRTIRMEAEAVGDLEARIDHAFERACELILAVPGRVVVTGMGKSGHVGGKVAATLASTGTPSFFVHPGEASHGDMGMITAADCVIALSNSGTTPEVLTLIPLLKRLDVPLISMTGAPHSPLAQASDAHLNTGVAVEACPLDLAPTSSTTTALVMGDALAIALLEARGFTAEDFAFSHPGGALGRKLLLKVQDVMRQGSTIPMVSADTTLAKALLEISAKGLGMTTVVEGPEGEERLLGVFTDGDLRRSLDEERDINRTLIRDIMTRDPATIAPGMLAAEALGRMEERAISSLVVLDGERLVGVVSLLGLLEAGLA